MLRKHHLATAVACVSAAVFATAVSAAAPNQRPITKPGYDPTAERVELFAGIEQEALEVQVIAKDEFGGNLLITNKTDKPLTVELPDSIVGVQVLPQDDFGFGDSGSSGSSGGGGQNQSFGGGLGGGLGGGGFGGGGLGGGGGFFSIPAEKVVRVPYHSVCLEHGKPEPNPRATYKIIPVEEYTDDANLQEVIRIVASGKAGKQAAQAAAWHVANEMSWQELAAKKYDRVGAPDAPYFSPQMLLAAQNIVAAAQQRAAEEPAAETEPTPAVTPRPVRRQTSTR